MERKETNTVESSGSDRSDMLARLRDTMEDVDWRNVQVAERLLAPYNLTFPQAAVLSILERQGPDLEMSHIAAGTGLPPSTITSIMDRLLQRHLVERRTHPTDRRRVTGSITDEGRAVVTELLEKRHALLTHLMEQFTFEEIELLESMMRRWVAISDEIIASREWPAT